MNDVDLINEAYAEMYNEGIKKTLGTIALVVLGILGAKEVAGGVKRSTNEYTHGLPSLPAPDDIDDIVAGSYINTYLNKIGQIKVALDPKHIEALKFIDQYSPNIEIKERAQHILKHQQSIAEQR